MAATHEVVGHPGGTQPLPHPQTQHHVERLNLAVQQQLNLESVKTRAISLFKAISRILEDIERFAHTNSVPKWQEVLGQYSMVNLELFNIVEDIKKVSKAFVVYPKNVNAENSTILPVMLSTKLLPEMEMDDNSKREQMLFGMQNLPISAQIENLKTRIDMIGAACENAEKILAETRKAYSLSNRQDSTVVSIDKVQAAKIQEQENLLRAAVNTGEGLRMPVDQRQIASVLPIHLVDVLSVADGVQAFPDGSGIYLRNNNQLSSSHINNQGVLLQASGAQVNARPVASPSTASVATPFDNTTASPLTYANSPRSSVAHLMNSSSPQQQLQQQQQQQMQQQQRQKMPLPHQQHSLTQQQFRQSSMAMPGLGQNQLNQLHDLSGQSQPKFHSLHGQHQMQFSQPLGQQQQQLAGRQLSSAQVQQSQLNQGNQLNRHLSQLSGGANSALFNAAQTAPNSQMVSNLSATVPSQPLMSRSQYAMSGGNPQRGHASQIINDQMFNMGSAANSNGMMTMQQQQQQHNMQNVQNLQQNFQQRQQQNQ